MSEVFRVPTADQCDRHVTEKAETSERHHHVNNRLHVAVLLVSGCDDSHEGYERDRRQQDQLTEKAEDPQVHVELDKHRVADRAERQAPKELRVLGYLRNAPVET